MKVLVIAEHDQRSLHQATRHVVSAALAIGGEVHVLVAGRDCDSVARQAAGLRGVARVKVVDAAQYSTQTAENLAALIVARIAGYTHVMAAASAFGKNLLPRVAALLDVEQISDICGVEASDVFVRPIYAGNALETVRNDESVKVLTVRTTAFEAVAGEGTAVIEAIPAADDTGLAELIEREIVANERPELGSARVVVAGGRGLGSAGNFIGILTPLADRLGAAIGASYGAVSAGYASNDIQIGQTGRIVAPGLYLAVGLSGAIQHVAGMKDSGVIVAINKDPEAPIFKIADYGLVADLFEAVPALVQALG